MSDAPTQRGLPPELDRIAHERRARLIAQLYEQAIAAANDLPPQQNAIKEFIAKDAQRRKAEARLFFAGAFVLALGCIIAVGYMLALWP